MTLDAAFADAVRRFGPREAVADTGDAATYVELDSCAARLAGWLQRQGVGRGDFVASFLPRGLPLTALLLAISRLGAVSASLDPSLPPKRRAATLGQLNPRLVVEAEDGAAIAARMRDAENPEAPAAEHGADDLAMIFFTSGSTGIPKGVAVPHVAITLLMRDPDFVPAGPEKRIAHVANPAFDALSFDLWAALLNGGCAVVFDDEAVIDPQRFANRVRDGRCDTAFLTTSLFKVMAEHAPAALAGMRHLLVGGEAFDPVAASRLYGRCPYTRLQLYNAYGPTEFATFSLVHRVARDRLPGYVTAGRVPIGVPVRGTEAIIRGEGGAPVGEGEVGELFLSGPRIARGYVGNPQETARRFVAVESGAGEPVLAYATGDRVRRNADGLVEYLGRLDDQVKVRGHRIELDDVLSAIVGQPGVVDATLVPRRAPDGPVALHAFLQLRGGASLDDVLSGVGESLPPYMRPASYHCLERIPLNRNGKADRRRLEALLETPGDGGPWTERGGLEAEFAAAYRKVLGRTPDLARSFAEGGGDSLAAVRIAAALGKSLGADLRFTDFVQRRPLRDVLADLARRLAADRHGVHLYACTYDPSA
ncbi:MAG: non-ribosomal peptide synthetase, partial [Allosphingosinicella sp.]